MSIDLDDLDDFFDPDDIDYSKPTSEQIYEIYGVFLNHFVKNTLEIDGRKIVVNTNKSNHPLFKSKNEGFVHIVTRESKHSGKRDFDKHRFNRLHWIRPILENRNDKRIVYFERLNDKNEKQYYYWFKEKSFIVILRELKSDLLLVTAFCTDKLEEKKYIRWYQVYKEPTS